jgi:tetratricopeptide (TPR) repeat protein
MRSANPNGLDHPASHRYCLPPAQVVPLQIPALADRNAEFFRERPSKVFREEHAMQDTTDRCGARRKIAWLVPVIIAAVAAQRGFAQSSTPPSLHSGNPSGATAKPQESPLPRLDTSSSRRAAANPAGTNSPAKAGPAGSYSNSSSSESDQAELQPSAAASGSSVFATSFDDPPPHPASTVDVATFNGVQPGETTGDDLIAKWGEGKQVSQTDTETVLSFAVESFPQVEVTLVENRVRTIVVHLEQSLPPDTLAHKLNLDDIRPVNVPDDSGELLGLAYPERGVLFSVTPDGKRVSHVVLEKVDLSPFVLRAEMDLQSHARSSFADLNYVLSRQPRNARALWLRSRLLADMARYDEALADVEAALSIEPIQPLYHLTRGEVLSHLDKYDEAGQETKSVSASASVPDEVKARAMCQLGDMLAASPAHDYKLAMEHHLSAIKLADPLSIDKHLQVRRAAKLVLIDAHLGVANDVAAGYWQQKDRVVAKWLDRANSYAEDMIDHEDGDPELRLHVARWALASCAAAQGKIDSVPWARSALQFGKPLIAASDDPWTKLRLQWELGLALCDGLSADDFRGAVQHALSNTALTVTYLETGAQARRETAEDAFRLGWLYYRMGSLHAVRRGDHNTAVAWYEKAYPLLDRPLPSAHTSEQGRYGEWLVSMGISYWETGSRDFALQLTDAGLQHVQEAVNRKLADEKALAIPYSNLAFMHETLGHKNEAQNFSQLATKYDPTRVQR